MKKFRLRPTTSKGKNLQLTTPVEFEVLHELLQDAVNKEKYELAAIIKGALDQMNVQFK